MIAWPRWRGFFLGLSAALAFVLAALITNTAAQPRRTQSFAVDQDRYVANAISLYRELIRGRRFMPERPPADWRGSPDVSCGGRNAEPCERYLSAMMAGNFRIIPPYEFSSQNPDLPDYRRIQRLCPRFDFEVTDPLFAPPGRATRNFALHRLTPPDQSPSEDDVLVYRAEKYASAPNPQWRGTALHPVVYDGFWTAFTIRNCVSIPLYNIRFPYDNLARSPGENLRSVHEIVYLDGQFMILQMYPVLWNAEHAQYFHNIVIWPFGNGTSPARFAHKFEQVGGE